MIKPSTIRQSIHKRCWLSRRLHGLAEILLAALLGGIHLGQAPLRVGGFFGLDAGGLVRPWARSRPAVSVR